MPSGRTLIYLVFHFLSAGKSFFVGQVFTTLTEDMWTALTDGRSAFKKVIGLLIDQIYMIHR